MRDFADVALIVCAILLALILLVKNREPQMVFADYQECVMVKNAPLLRTPRNKVDYRLGRPPNDKGNA